LFNEPEFFSKILGIFFMLSVSLILINKFFGNYLIKFINKIESAKSFKYLFSADKQTDSTKASLIIGKIFRTIFIITLGIVIYNLMPNISNAQFSHMTLNQLLGYLGGLIAIIVIAIWLFKGSDENGYGMWSIFFYLICLIGLLIWMIVSLL